MLQEPTDGERIVTAAHRHYPLVPVGRDSKVSLTRWDEREFSLGELIAHVRRGGNIAARVGETRAGIRALVVDRDARDAATWAFLREHRLHRSSMQVETASGNWHLWFQLPPGGGEVRTRIKLVVAGKKLPIDVKATGYVLLPGSTIGGKPYRFREGFGLKTPGELTPAPDSLLELIREQRPVSAVTAGTPIDAQERLLRYVERIDAAVMGESGSTACMKAMLKVLSLVGGDVDKAWPLALHYNRTRCKPAFDEAITGGPDSLRRKLLEARKFWKPYRR